VEAFKEKVSLTFLFSYSRLDALLMVISAEVDSYEKIKDAVIHLRKSEASIEYIKGITPLFLGNRLILQLPKMVKLNCLTLSEL